MPLPHPACSPAAVARSRLRLASLTAMALLLAACASHQRPTKPAYVTESFSTTSPFHKHLNLPPEASCRLGTRALLSQGYGLENGSGPSAPAGSMDNTVRGSKYFQPDSSQQMRLEISLVCLPDSDGTAVYVRAVQTRSELKKAASSTGLSVAGIGSINLPWSEGNEALVKVGEMTVSDPDFYRRFFELLEMFVDSTPLAELQAPATPATVPASPPPAVPVAAAPAAPTLPPSALSTITTAAPVSTVPALMNDPLPLPAEIPPKRD